MSPGSRSKSFETISANVESAVLRSTNCMQCLMIDLTYTHHQLKEQGPIHSAPTGSNRRSGKWHDHERDCGQSAYQRQNRSAIALELMHELNLHSTAAVVRYAVRFELVATLDWRIEVEMLPRNPPYGLCKSWRYCAGTGSPVSVFRNSLSHSFSSADRCSGWISFGPPRNVPTGSPPRS